MVNSFINYKFINIRFRFLIKILLQIKKRLPFRNSQIIKAPANNHINKTLFNIGCSVRQSESVAELNQLIVIVVLSVFNKGFNELSFICCAIVLTVIGMNIFIRK